MWWNEEWKIALRESYHASNRVEKDLSTENLIELQKTQSQISQNDKKQWEGMMESLYIIDHRTNEIKVLAHREDSIPI